MTHTLTITGLDDFEAEHIGHILSSYKAEMLAKKIEAMVEDHKAGGGIEQNGLTNTLLGMMKLCPK